MSRIVFAIVLSCMSYGVAQAEIGLNVYNADIQPIEIWVKPVGVKSWQSKRVRHLKLAGKERSPIIVPWVGGTDFYLRQWAPSGTQFRDIVGDGIWLDALVRSLSDESGSVLYPFRVVGEQKLENGKWVRVNVVAQISSSPDEFDLGIDIVDGALYFDFPQPCKKLEDDIPPLPKPKPNPSPKPVPQKGKK